MKNSSDFGWNKQFKEGRENVEDDERNCQLECCRTDENFEKVLTESDAFR
jgi:hypothetical protein